MTFKLWLDNGATWPAEYHLLIDEGDGFGYSSLTKVDKDNIGILYEGSRSQMCFQVIPLKDIVAGN